MLHAYSVPFTGFAALGISAKDPNTYRREFRSEAAHKLGRFRGTIEAIPRTWRSAVREGDPRAVILREVRRRHPDFVVVGARGARAGPARALLGSVAEYVVRAADCDVVVVR